MSDWKSNIAIKKRIYSTLKLNFIKYIYNPCQVCRRKYGFSKQDIFKHILIQTNYKCTRRCSFCHYGQAIPPMNTDMKEELFYSIINQLKEINYKGRVGFFEMNEPLTDKRLIQFIEYSRNMLPNAWFFIATNGDLLNLTNVNELFMAGLNYIYLNSYDDSALRKNNILLEQIEKNIAKNIGHLNRTYQTEWSSRGGNIEEYQKRAVDSTCDRVHEILYIKPTGKVYSCYNDFYNINEMGDLHKDKILNIWFGDKFKLLRDKLINRKRYVSQLCAQCDYVGYDYLPTIPLRWSLKNILIPGKTDQ